MENLIHAEKKASQETTTVLSEAQRKKLLVSGTIGNFLEIFDFTIYGYFAGVIGEIFFKSHNPMISLLISVSVFGLGFITRPLGSIVIGGYCDKYGRKSGLFLAIMLMGAGSALIAFTPTYASIGIFAPAIIIIGRLLQGFSAGGQIAAAGSLLLESAPKNRRGYFVSWQFVVQTASSFAGSFCAYLVNSLLSSEQVYDWGWRIPFFISLLIVPVGFYMRKHITETHVVKKEKKEMHPFLKILKTHRGRFIKSIFMFAPCAVHTYVMIVYMPQYLAIENLMHEADRYLLTAVGSIIAGFTTFFSGYACDRVQKRKFLLILSYSGALLSAFLTFHFSYDRQIFLVCYAFVSFFEGFLMVLPCLYLMESFPKDIRVTATGAVYAFSITIFGSMAQAIVTILLNWSDKNPMAPFWYLGSAILLGIIFGSWLPEKRYEE